MAGVGRPCYWQRLHASKHSTPYSKDGGDCQRMRPKSQEAKTLYAMKGID